MRLTPGRLIQRGLIAHRRAHAAVAAGAAVATAVLVGALVVGDSVRSSLRERALDRLGPYEWAVVPGRPFDAGLAEQFLTLRRDASPAIIAPASASARIEGKTRRASGLTLVGGLLEPGADYDAVITEPLADELGLADGDALVIRSAAFSAIPGESPLGEKQDTMRSLRLRRVRVAPADGLATFSLQPTQATPRNVFVSLSDAQQLLEIEGRCTALLIERNKQPLPPVVKPTLASLGLTLIDLGEGDWQLESESLVLPDEVTAATQEAFETDVRRCTTYLANRIEHGDRSIPYSTIAAVGGMYTQQELVEQPSEQNFPQGWPVTDADGVSATLSNDEIALTGWAAADLGAQLGDTITLYYYEPESTHGVLTEGPPLELKLAAITPLLDSDGQPTAANDRRWTPQLEGVTDTESINDWDLPFELVETIRPQDEDYWDEYNTTPKAFISEATATRLWSTRWGTNSLIRFRTDDPQAIIEQRLLDQIDPADFGFTPINLRQQSLAAASGNTPFDVLFLLFSLFIMVSACALVALLVRLAIEARSGEAGLLGAMGFGRRFVTRVLLGETLLAVGVGAVVGTAVGVLYAAALLGLLRTVWIDAIGTPFLTLHASTPTLIGGALLGFCVAGITAWRVVSGMTAKPPKQLIGSHPGGSVTVAKPNRWKAIALIVVPLLGAIVAGLAGRGQQGEAAAGAFFASGGATLATLLAAGWIALQPKANSNAAIVGFWRLAFAGVGRNRGRSLLIAGLVAAASFLVLATSAFRLSPTEEGVGGYAIVAETDSPILYNLDTPEGRFELGFSEQDEELLADWQVAGFRVQPGEDASCQNLYQPRTPRVLGVPTRWITKTDRFAWAALADPRQGGWEQIGDSGSPVPTVLDFNTATYSLKLYGGVGSTFPIDDVAGTPRDFVVVGLLKNSVLQGDVLVGQDAFLNLYPDVAGERFFLLRSSSGSPAGPVIELLENRLSDFGLDAEPTEVRLARFLAVQNTYLSTFQSLGALGLLLGVAGLAIAQYRNLVERRGELALMRATGFSAQRLGRLVLAETLVLVGAGLAMGAISAVVALAPLGVSTGSGSPWLSAIVLCVLLLATAVVAGHLAATAMLRAPVTPALRGD